MSYINVSISFLNDCVTGVTNYSIQCLNLISGKWVTPKYVLNILMDKIMLTKLVSSSISNTNQMDLIIYQLDLKSTLPNWAFCKPLVEQ